MSIFPFIYIFASIWLLIGVPLTAQEVGSVNEALVLNKRFQNDFLGTVEVSPDFELDGAGNNVDTITFWETQDPDSVLMFVTAKANQLVEVWRYPFIDNELSPLQHSSFGSDTRVNGVVMDQENDLLYVSISDPASTVSVFAYPGAEYVREFIEGSQNLGSEPSLTLFRHINGETWLLVTANNIVYVYNVETGEFLNEFEPVTDIETVIADEFFQVIYLPDESDHQGIYAYNSDWTPYLRAGTNNFGSDNIFQSDAEGILLYSYFPDSTDDGSGLIVVSDQRDDQTEFEFFDRQNWEYLGTLKIEGVSNTDGIASTQKELPPYPLGLFVAINDDQTTVGVGWEVILDATGLGPVTSVPDNSTAIPAKIELLQNYPNPFNPETNIEFSLTEAASVRLEIFNLNGQLVRTLLNEIHQAGVYTIKWDGTDHTGLEVGSGIYLLSLTVDEFHTSRKIVLQR